MNTMIIMTRHLGSTAGVLFIGLCAWLLTLGGPGARAGAISALRVSPELHDFGAVPRLGGEVETTFALHNQVDRPLTIRRIWTS